MTAISSALPVLGAGDSVSGYIRRIRKFPLLSQQEEYMLSKRFKEHGDIQAAHKLTTSHLRLVVKIASGYRGYGLPFGEIISEGNIGLMMAVKKFDPDKGFRLTTYAIWWIRAAIQEYVLRSWSLVKIGTTAAQKKLFFNLKRIRRHLGKINNDPLDIDEVGYVSRELGVQREEVVSMDSRLGGDFSLNAPVKKDEGAVTQWQDWLVDDSSSPETSVAERDERDYKRAILAKAMRGLNAREREILLARRIREPSRTLEDLAGDFGISRERVRQIEMRAVEKLRLSVLSETQKVDVASLKRPAATPDAMSASI